MRNEMTKRMSWRHGLLLALGVWVFITPWVTIDFSTAARGLAWNFWIVGAVIFTAAALALRSVKPAHEWVNFAAGFWLLFSPWIFDYSGNTNLLWNTLFSGLAVVGLSVAALPIAGRARIQSSRERRSDEDRAA